MPRFVVIAKDPLIAAEAAALRLPGGVACERHYAGELKFEQVLAQLGTADLFATQRAIHYVDIVELKLSKSEALRLTVLLSELPPELTLVCSQVVAAGTKGDEEKFLRKPEFTRFADGTQLDNLLRLSDAVQAEKWLITRARDRHALALNPAQAKQIYRASGEQLAVAAAELAKLELLKDGDKLQPVSDAELAQTLSHSPSARFYELADAIMAAAPGAQAQLLAWFHAEPETHRLVAELRRRLLGLRALALGEKVYPPFFEKQLLGTARQWPGPRLQRAIILLAELEHALKGGGTLAGETSEDAELNALQVFTADLAALR